MRRVKPADRRPLWARILVGLLRTIVWIVIAVVILLGSVLLHLDTEPSRQVACAQIEPLLDGLLQGDFSMQCVELSLRRVRVKDFEVRDAEGVVVVSAEEVSADPSLRDLMRGVIAIERARIINPFVTLSSDSAGNMRIAEVFLPVDQTPSEDVGPDLTIRISDARIENGTVRDVPDAFGFTGLNLAADIEVVGADTTIDAHLDGAAKVHHQDDDVGELESVTARIEIYEGGRSEFDARVAFPGEDFVEANMVMPWGAESLEQLDFDVRLHASPQLVASLHQAEIAGMLATDVGGTVVATLGFADTEEGGIGEIVADVDLTTDGGDIAIDAHTEGETYRVTVVTERLNLPQVLVGIPGEVSAALEAELLPRDDGIHAILRGEGLRYDEWVVPSLETAVLIGDEALVVERLDLPYLSEGGHLDVSGRFSYAGDLRLHVDADLPQLARDANLRRVVPGLRAGVQTELDLSLDMNTQRIDAEGFVRGRSVAVSGVTVGSVDVRGDVRGALLTPDVDVHVVASAVNTGSLVIDRANLIVHGGPTRDGYGSYRVTGAVDAEGDPSADLDIRVAVGPDVYTFDGSAYVDGFWPERVELELDQVQLRPGQAISARNLTVAAGESIDLTATGTYRFQGRSDARIAIRKVDLATVDAVMALGQGIEGIASMEIAFSGTPQAPILDTAGRVEGLVVRDIAFDTATWDIDLTHAGRGSDLRAVLELDGGEQGHLEMDMRAALPGRNPLRALPDARFEGRVVTNDFVLRTLAPFVEGMDGIGGTVDLELDVAGSMRDPERIALHFVANEVVAMGIEPLGVDGSVVLEGGQLRTEILVDDAEETRLAEIRGALTVDLWALIQGQPPKTLLQDAWYVSLDVPERRLQEIPQPYAVDIPGLAELHARFDGGTRETVLGGVSGEVTGSLRYDAEPGEGCAEGRPSVDLRMVLQDGHSNLTIDGEVAGRRALRIVADADTPVEQWILEAPTALPEVEVAMEASELDLGGIPIACRYASGVMNGRMNAQHIFGESPTVDMRYEVGNLVIEESEPLDFDLEASADSQRGELEMHLHNDERIALLVRGAVPLRWGGADLYPALRDESWEVQVIMNHTPIQPMLAAVPQVGQPRGHLDGQVALLGVGSDFSLRGGVELENVALTIRQPLMRLENVRGHLALDDHGLRFEDVGFSDRDGTVQVNGDVRLDGWTPTGARLRVAARDMPIRAQGIVYAFVTSDIVIEASLAEDDNDILIEMSRTDVRLPADLGRSVQALDQHEDVLYEDQPGFDPNQPFEEQVAEEDSEFIPMRIRVRSEPFWVRREDFSISLKPTLDIIIEEDGARLEGPVEIRRGFIALLGKQFDFRQGEIRFAGGREIDPRLNLRAVHEIRGAGEVEVAITGTLLRPELTFSTTVPGVEGEAQILALLVSGRGNNSSQSAQNETASFLAGLTAGILSNITRREVGEYLPVFGIEATDNSGRVRIGFNADRLIPKFLRGLVLGAYVEGFAGAQDQGGVQATGGVLVEFILPRSLVFTTTYEAGNNWSVELRWEPL